MEKINFNWDAMNKVLTKTCFNIEIFELLLSKRKNTKEYQGENLKKKLLKIYKDNFEDNKYLLRKLPEVKDQID